MPLLSNSKLWTLDLACERVAKSKHAGRKIVLTNGCFDLLHPGHVYSLTQAAALGDELWVALNADQSVKGLKGPSRPIWNQEMRAYMLAALSCVTGLVLFNTLRLDAEIRALAPHVYAKSGDYSLKRLDPGEREALESVGARLEFVSHLSGFSTTHLIEQLQA